MDANEKKLAAEARNAYARKWRAANPDKVRANNASYWLRRAAKEAARKEAEERGEDGTVLPLVSAIPLIGSITKLI